MTFDECGLAGRVEASEPRRDKDVSIRRGLWGVACSSNNISAACVAGSAGLKAHSSDSAVCLT